MSRTCFETKSHVIADSIKSIFNLQNVVASNVLPCTDFTEAPEISSADTE